MKEEVISLLLLLIDWLIIIQYVYVCTITNKNIQVLKLNIVLPLFVKMIFWNRNIFYGGQILGVWYGLIQFTLFQMEKFNSKLESRTVSWNGLCSEFEIPLYILRGVSLVSLISVKKFKVTQIICFWKYNCYA
jgi:hypothetical protein